MPPSPQSPTRQLLRARLRELVAGLPVGERLPGERELSERWQVARMTLRGAIDALVTEGLLERRHGSGTYVLPRPLVRALGLTSFSQDMRSRGLVPGSRLLSFRTIPADGALSEQMQIPAGDPVHQFARLRLGSGEAMAVETTWIPAQTVPGLAESDLAGSLYEVLAERYGILMGAARVTIEPVLPDSRVRELLGIANDQACLRLRMVDTDTRGRVLMVANCVYRGDKYQLTADVSGAAFPVAAGVRRAG
ncbi:GntR family transcriptional regulator [Leifsonia sp. H3M29-4]|uniref:GntR family transcriptional regulator n=1 Tax=Salinibacterium metalliresistens TaxID=3031321 RepID=UPI0023DB9231|nr:GntR family transcriptional regulator [Salinibacterium metalliresistens]MDF1477850.1 GntR family transcriptional regulator [Salinibacterium metalliresistens]